MPQFIDGLYYALLEGRFMFDFVHEDDLGPETVGRYSALLLPNIAWLSDRPMPQIRDYAARGGSVMASFETAMFDENGHAPQKFRPRRPLRDRLRRRRRRPRTGTASMPASSGQHEILKGFEDTNWIPGGAYRLPVKAAGALPLSVVPAYTAYPPELSYNPSPEHTDDPAVIVRENGDSRLLYLRGRPRARGLALGPHGPRPPAAEFRRLADARGRSRLGSRARA